MCRVLRVDALIRQRQLYKQQQHEKREKRIYAEESIE